MQEVPGSQPRVPIDQRASEKDILDFHRPKLCQPSLSQGECRVQGRHPVHREIGMEQLLEDLGGTHQGFT